MHLNVRALLYTKSLVFFFLSLLFLPGFVLFLSISVSLLEKLEDETKLQETRKSEMSKNTKQGII
jgi:uncharacterized SAM-binding protein YcdF (DUF218 family)